MVSSSSLCKNKEVLAKNGGEKWNQYRHRVGSMSLLNMAPVCIRVGFGTSHLVFHLPLWVWVIPFDLSSSLCLVTMTSEILMSKYCQVHCRAVHMFKRSWPLQVPTFLWFSSECDSQKHYVPLSRIDDVGNTMAHLRSRSLPVDFGSLSRKLI